MGGAATFLIVLASGSGRGGAGRPPAEYSLKFVDSFIPPNRGDRAAPVLVSRRGGLSYALLSVKLTSSHRSPVVCEKNIDNKQSTMWPESKKTAAKTVDSQKG